MDIVNLLFIVYSDDSLIDNRVTRANLELSQLLFNAFQAAHIVDEVDSLHRVDEFDSGYGRAHEIHCSQQSLLDKRIRSECRGDIEGHSVARRYGICIIWIINVQYEIVFPENFIYRD